MLSDRAAGSWYHRPMAFDPSMAAMYGDPMTRQSTGPTGLTLGAFGAPGAWDGGYNATYQHPPGQSQTTPPSSGSVAAGAAAPGGSAAGTSGPPPPMPTGGTWGDQAHLDYFSQYGAGNSGLSQEQVNALTGKPSAAPSAGTVAYNQAQQQFTGNNQGYAGSGYLGNADQVASQQADGRQASSIPTGVLGTDFNPGGTSYGGAQTADNTASGGNGATNWAGSTYGVTKKAPQTGDAYQAWRSGAV